MEDYYDVTESLFSAKADEGMIAFAGFMVPDGAVPGEGVLKVAAFRRSDGSGYLTLTFILDLEADPDRKAAFQACFRRVDQETLTARLGADFEMLIEVPLNPFAASTRFFIEELNLYFRRLAGRERPLLEAGVIPVLDDLLGVRFEPLEWLAEAGRGVSSPTAGGVDQSDVSPTQRLRQRLDRFAGRLITDSKE